MIGDKIKERRLELNLTQAQLSKLTGIKSTTISNYENNISSPSDENIYKFMEVLKCDANFLFEWEEVKNFNLSCAEKTRIKKIRQLDAHGTKIVDLVLNEEYERCTSIVGEQQEAIYISKTAARNGNPPEERLRTQEEIDEIRSRPDADPDL